MMTRRECRFALIGRCAAIASLTMVGVADAAQPAARRPNVIVILADDLGYSDLSCQGGKLVETPHIDSIARNGVRCTNAYVSGPVCAPTRAGLMTGRYQQRFGLEFNPQPSGGAGESGLPRTEITIAEALAPLGYATGMVGKWHLGGGEGLRPSERGFQEFFGFLEGAHRFSYDPTYDSDPAPFVPYNRAVMRGVSNVVEKEYLTDAFTREAVAFVERHADEPFFLYLPYNAVHSPLDATPELRARVAHIGPPKLQAYAAMLVSMDDGVGRVLDTLARLDIDDDTLVFFTSDNGGAPQPHNETNNLPLRGKKGELLEGGIRVPLLAQWNGVIPPATTVDELVIQLDIFATAVALAGGALQSDRTIDGRNVAPLLSGKDKRPVRDALFWRYGEPHAVRFAQWKLLKTGDAPSQLYDLSADIGETTDLAASYPDVVRQLEQRLAEWDSTLVEPMWPSQPPHAKNVEWLYSVLGDPRLAAPAQSSPPSQ